MLQVVEQYEEEINQFANDEASSSEEEPSSSTGFQAPKVVKAVLAYKSQKSNSEATAKNSTLN